MFLRQITDPALAQHSYLIGCQKTGEAAIIDPERDVDRYLKLAEENDLRLTIVADTHIHADYLSGARELVERHGAHGYFSAEGGEDWQFEWARSLDNVTLLRDGDSFHVGKIEIKALLTPGHTPEHLSFLVTDHGGGADEPIALLSGDFLFVGDVGRPDLLESAAGKVGAMEPAARDLYQSLRGTAPLPGFLQILPAHGAGSACGKSLGAVPNSVLDYERRFNEPLRMAIEGERDDFVATILDGQPEPPLYFARMKRDNRRGPELLPAGRPPHPERLSAANLAEWIGKPGRSVLDLRNDRKNFMSKHLKGSLFAPPAGGKLSAAAGSYVDEDDEILLLVEDKSDGAGAVLDLIRIGLDHVSAWMPVAEALAESPLTGSIRRISPTDLGAELDKHDSPSVLDVRGAGEFKAGHVKGAHNIAHTRLAARTDDVPSGHPLLVHCGSGMRAALASAFLAREGYEVVHIDGAFDDIPDKLRE